MSETKKSVFISYAHKDGLDFTRRLAYALSMYMDVFWDRRLPATDYPKELEAQIENRDYLLLVMTPFSINSEWCQRELHHAEKHGRDIVLARIFSGEGTTDPQLISKYTFGDFTEDFDAGFRRITAMMLGQPLSSWEYFPESDDKSLLNYLKRGLLPTSIAKNIAEWSLVDILWKYTNKNYINIVEIQGDIQIVRGNPRTPSGILRQSGDLIKYFTKQSNSKAAQLFSQISSTAKSFEEQLQKIPDDDTQKAGEIAFNMLVTIYDILQSREFAGRSAYGAQYVTQYFYFDVAEKIREIINAYAGRSKYLY